MNLPALLTGTLLALAAFAGTAGSPPAAAVADAKPLPPARGEVLEVDLAAGTVLVKHGRVASLGMDPMTMEFLVPDRKLLASLKPGDQLRFQAAYRNGDYLLTAAEHVKPRTRKPAKAASGS